MISADVPAPPDLMALWFSWAGWVLFAALVGIIVMVLVTMPIWLVWLMRPDPYRLPRAERRRARAGRRRTVGKK